MEDLKYTITEVFLNGDYQNLFNCTVKDENGKEYRLSACRLDERDVKKHLAIVIQMERRTEADMNKRNSFVGKVLTY